jgi:hypothetical protein
MSTMPPRFYEDRFALGRFIIDRANSLAITRRELVERLGFRDRLAKGHEVLSEIMLTGTVPRYLTKLADALEVEPTLLDDILYATAQQQEAEWQAEMLAHEEAYREGFRPHIQVQTQRQIPSPIFVAALLTVRRLRIVDLEALPAGDEERDEIVTAAITKHYRETRGQVPAFGRITGYILVLLAGFRGTDFGLPFDRAGCPTGQMISVRRLPEAMLGRRHPDGLLNGLLKDIPLEVISVSPTE